MGLRVGRDDASVAWLFVAAGALVALFGLVPLGVGVHDLVLARSLAAQGRAAVATEVSVHVGTDLRGDRSTFVVDGVRGSVAGLGERDIIAGEFSLPWFERVVEVDPEETPGWRAPGPGLSVTDPLEVRVDAGGHAMSQAQVDRWLTAPALSGPVAWSVFGLGLVGLGVWARRRALR